jgi:hypothetical protein
MIMQAALNATMRQSLLDDLNAALGATAVLQMWSGTPPATIADADAGTMIAEFECSDTVFGALVGDLSQANAIMDNLDTDSGSPSYWRLKTATGGSTILQWTEGVDFITDDPTFDAGDTCHIEVLEITFSIGPPDA